MKVRTQSEVDRFFDDLFPESIDHFYIEWEAETGFLSVARQYEPINLTFQHWKEISDFFGTEKLSFVDDIAEGGCETCDFGSRYGFKMQVG